MPSISVPAAIVGSSVLGAGASLLGGSQQAKAAKGAQATQMAMFNQTQQNLSPFLAAGQQGATGLEGLLGVGPGAGPGGAPDSAAMMARLAQTPGYQFALQQGLQATQNSFAAQGLGQSGPALKGAAQYAEGLASTTYQNQIGNFQNLMQTGANAAIGLGQQSNVAAQQAGQFGTSGAAAGAAGLVGASNALGGGGVNAALFNQLGMFGGSSGGAGQFAGAGVPSGVNITQSPAGFNSGYQWGP